MFNGISIIPHVEELVPERGTATTLTAVREDLYELHVDPKSGVWRELGIGTSP